LLGPAALAGCSAVPRLFRQPIQRPVSKLVLPAMHPRALLEGVGGSAPVTTNFTSAQVIAGFAGPINTTTTPARCVIRASITTWFGRIRGTEAILTVASHANTANVISVSVDGGAFTTKSTISNLATLFTGLSDTYHTVAFRSADAFGNNVYVSNTGSDILAVTGVSPAIDVPSSMVQAGKSGDLTAITLAANTASFVPENGGSSFIGSVAFSGSPTKLYIACKAVYVAVSVDGAAPSYYTTNSRGGVIVSCDGAAHTYYVWSGVGVSGGFTPWMFSVGGDATLSQLGSQKRIHHFAHSIGFGVSATSMAHTDMSRTAARKGYVFNNVSVAGNTIAQLQARIDANLALLTVTSSDVAIIDIGRNEATSAALDATQQTNLNYVIDACQAKGYGKILVLGGIIDNGWNPYTGGQAGSMSTLVTAQADANCIYIDRSNYKTIGASGTIATLDGTLADNVHPSDAGYVTMNTLNITYLDPSIP
jgi:lysophospholipase L1-like esterase